MQAKEQQHISPTSHLGLNINAESTSHQDHCICKDSLMPEFMRSQADRKQSWLPANLEMPAESQ